jgi:hypothetical protein
MLLTPPPPLLSLVFPLRPFCFWLPILWLAFLFFSKFMLLLTSFLLVVIGIPSVAAVPAVLEISIHTVVVGVAVFSINAAVSVSAVAEFLLLLTSLLLL